MFMSSSSNPDTQQLPDDLKPLTTDAMGLKFEVASGGYRLPSDLFLYPLDTGARIIVSFKNPNESSLGFTVVAYPETEQDVNNLLENPQY